MADRDSNPANQNRIRSFHAKGPVMLPDWCVRFWNRPVKEEARAVAGLGVGAGQDVRSQGPLRTSGLNALCANALRLIP